jgi:hypothetical protein
MTSASTDRSRSDPVHIPALGWALTITLVVLYLLCWIAALAVRELPLAHGWLLLFSTAEPGFRYAASSKDRSRAWRSPGYRRCCSVRPTTG